MIFLTLWNEKLHLIFLKRVELLISLNQSFLQLIILLLQSFKHFFIVLKLNLCLFIILALDFSKSLIKIFRHLLKYLLIVVLLILISFCILYFYYIFEFIFTWVWNNILSKSNNVALILVFLLREICIQVWCWFQDFKIY